MAKYTPTKWQDSLFDEEGNRVQKGTALSADNLNKIEQGVKAADDKVDVVQTEISKLPKRSEFDAVTQQLADTAITPESYTGNDLEKVQAAINDAVREKRSVRFSRMYDITGLGTIIFDKPETDRTVLHLLGEGGGITKSDIGYVYTGSGNNMGDISETNMKYLGGGLVGTIVWNCDRLIRINSVNCGYDKIDVLEAKTRWAQTLNFQNFTVTRNPDWAFSWKQSFDVKLNGFIEIGNNGIRNTGYTANPDNFNLKIDCMIEGMLGQGVELGSCAGTEISTYMEQNRGGYVDLSKSNDYHVGLSVTRGVFAMFPEQIANNTKAIKWGKFGNDGVFSRGNFSNGDLHEVEKDAGSNGKLVHVSDRATGVKITDPSMAIDLMDIRHRTITTTTAGKIYDTPTFKVQHTKVIQTPVIPFGGELSVTIPLPGKVSSLSSEIGQIVSFRVGGSLSSDYQIVRYSFTADHLGVSVVLKNLHKSDSQHFLVTATIQEFK